MVLTLVALLLAVASEHVIAQGNVTTLIREFVVGGGNAGPTPHQASLQQDGHFCGGVIINRRWVLTAAHCLMDIRPREMTVVVGTTQLSRGGTRFRVARLVVHPEYDRSRAANEIALVQIRGIFLWLPNRVGKIEISKSYIEDGTEATITGWGGTLQSGGPLSGRLQYARLKVVGEGRCKTLLANIGDWILCTFTKEGQGICGGDSGSPLVSDGKLIGIASFGVGFLPGEGCAAGRPDGFARVSHFYDWIRETIQRRRIGTFGW
uniref:trypsin n=1 Tax=Ochlerotatus triseriatus TaxID=7162 RepID=C6ZQY2_OCHTR